MSFTLWIYHNLNIFLGLINISYDRRTNNYNQYHWPTLIYCGFINLCSLIMLHITRYMQWNIYKNNYKVILVISTFLNLGQYILSLTIILESWFKRNQIFIIFNKFKCLLKTYKFLKDKRVNYKFDTNTRKLLLIKIFSNILQLIVIFMELFKSLKVSPNCKAIDRYCVFYYIIQHIYGIILALCTFLLENNIYLGLVFIYMCINALTKYLKQIVQDIRLMNHMFKFRQSPDLKNRTKSLKQDILSIAKFERDLNNYVQNFIHTFQFQFVLILITSSVVILMLIFICFYLISPLLNQPNIDANLLQLIILTLFFALTNFFNIILLFNICELLIKSFKEMRFWAYEIIVCASLETKGLFLKSDIRNVS